MGVGDDRSSMGADEAQGRVDDLCILGCVWGGRIGRRMVVRMGEGGEKVREAGRGGRWV